MGISQAVTISPLQQSTNKSVLTNVICLKEKLTIVKFAIS